jgi:hypothetical protein
MARILSLLLGVLTVFVTVTAFSAPANQTRFEDKSFWKKIRDEVSLSYYVSLMGPSPGLPVDQTYNVFLDGRGPLQTFHAFNLRWQFDSNWAVGATLAGIHHFTSPVRNAQGGIVSDNGSEFFNGRVYLSVPTLDFSLLKMFNTFSLELPTSKISKGQQMHYGLVLSQVLAFKLPPSKFTAGWLSQVIRYEYAQSTQPPPFVGGRPTPLQTTLVTTGPYLNYQISAQWQFASLVSFDWDQRGNQTDKWEFNNNLEDRIRLAVNYFFQTKPFTHVGVYTQVLTKMRDDTSIIGIDFSLRF